MSSGPRPPRAVGATPLEWERAYGIAPAITGALSEYDAARLIGLSYAEFRDAIGQASAVQKGYDFKWDGVRYQIKANRPSGKVGSFVTLVSKAKNYDFDVLIWLLYDKDYELKEAWSFRKRTTGRDLMPCLAFGQSR
jgi:hypothetical protein